MRDRKLPKRITEPPRVETAVEGAEPGPEADLAFNELLEYVLRIAREREAQREAEEKRRDPDAA